MIALKSLVLGTPGEAGGPTVGGLLRIIRFVGQLRLLVRPEGRAWMILLRGPINLITSYSINATGSQRGLSSQPCFIEVANPREQPYSGIKWP